MGPVLPKQLSAGWVATPLTTRPAIKPAGRPASRPADRLAAGRPAIRPADQPAGQPTARPAALKGDFWQDQAASLKYKKIATPLTFLGTGRPAKNSLLGVPGDLPKIPWGGTGPPDIFFGWPPGLPPSHATGRPASRPADRLASRPADRPAQLASQLAGQPAGQPAVRPATLKRNFWQDRAGVRFTTVSTRTLMARSQVAPRGVAFVKHL